MASVDEQEALLSEINAWDLYAKALCDLPESEGAPWLNAEIPWPTKPE